MTSSLRRLRAHQAPFAYRSCGLFAGLLLAVTAGSSCSEENVGASRVRDFATDGADSGAGAGGSDSSEAGAPPGTGSGGASSVPEGGIFFDAGGMPGPSGLGRVPETCDEAIRAKSYIGCEYWPTVTLNSELYASFQFAIAAANPTASDGKVTVEQDGKPIAEVALPAGELRVVKLPWVPELKGDFGKDGSTVQSALVPAAAFHVASTVPITLYQFNPLQFELTPAPMDCPAVSDIGHCYSFTNDASLVLPTAALGEDYYVIARPTAHYSVRASTASLGPPAGYANLGGFVSVTAVEDGTTVTVKSSSAVRAGTGVTALAAGDNATYKLDKGDVLQLVSGAMPDAETGLPSQPCKAVPNGPSTLTFCPATPDYDLTGSRVTADKPISVIGGHDCAMIPYDTLACDHNEESLFPIDALGNDLLVTTAEAGSGDHAAAMFVRVLSATDNNHVTFDPPSVSGPLVLGAGQWTEIGPVTTDFRVHSDDKIMVAQFMVSANSETPPQPTGDPSESIGIPTEQYRRAYTFYAPDTYTSNYVNVVAPTGATVTIDNVVVSASEFSAIGSSGFGVARHGVSGGTHRMSGDKPFGIVIYGYGRYTSYMYPGGLNLETITIVPK